MAIVPAFTPTCPICSKPFKAYRDTAVYCSSICRNKAYELRAWNVSVTCTFERQCKICESTFQTSFSAKIYCSPECKLLSRVDEWRPFRIFERDFFRCVYCGKTSIEDGIKLHADHIYPKSKGGKDIAGNLVTACSICNVSKSNRIISPSVQRRLILLVHQRNEENNLSDNAVIKMVGNS
jgi:5-methylcytosine-specific restriction endonuclease McrA